MVALPNNSTAAVVHIQKDLLVSDSAPDVQRFRPRWSARSLDPKIFDHLRFSALASQAPFIRRLPIYAGVERTSVSQGQRMPTFRPGKFTVIQNGLAPENEPIFFYRRPGLKPQRGAHFSRIQSKANTQYAIQKTGVNRGSDHADQGAPAAIPFLRSPDPLQKRSLFSPRDRHTRVRGAARKSTAKSQFEMLSPGAYERSPRRPRTPAILSNPVEQAYLTLMADEGSAHNKSRPSGPPEKRAKTSGISLPSVGEGRILFINSLKPNPAGGTSCPGGWQ